MTNRLQVPVDDVVLHYDDIGTGATPLLLLHGFTGAAIDFTDVVGSLARWRRVVAYDQRGHGDSTNTGDAATYTFDRLTRDLVAFVDALDLAPLDLIGHSMGGIIAMRYALDHPDAVHSLVLMDTGAAPAARVADMFGSLIAMGRSEGMDAVFGVVRSFWIAQAEASGTPVDPKILARVESKFSRMDPEAFAAFADELGAYPSMVERLGEIKCPVTVLVGKNDTGLRASSDVLAERIPDSELVVIADAGHSPQEDQPAAWIDAVRHHFTRASAPQ